MASCQSRYNDRLAVCAFNRARLCGQESERPRVDSRLAVACILIDLHDVAGDWRAQVARGGCGCVYCVQAGLGDCDADDLGAWIGRGRGA